MNNNIIQLEKDFKTLLPWWTNLNEKFLLSEQTESSVKSVLDTYYLFPLCGINISNTIDDIPKFINERFQTLLSAIYSANIEIVTVIRGEKGKLSFYIGFKTVDGSKIEPDYYKSILNGIFPGENIELYKKDFSTMFTEMPFGGLITGIPALKDEDEKKYFNISTIVRSLYGKDYTLVIKSTPISYFAMQKQLQDLFTIKDRCNQCSKNTISKAENEQLSISETKNKGNAVNAILYSRNWGSSKSENLTKGTTDTITYDQQNSLAIELEKIAEHFIDRIKQGFNIGYWETTITFATKEKVTSDILGGSFIGELSKPSDKLYPPRLYTDKINPNKFLFLPKEDLSISSIFPRNLSSYLTSSELALIASPAYESLPGYEIKKMPQLAFTDKTINGEIEIGRIADYGIAIENSKISLSKSDLNKHLFVCGLTGSGKSTTIKHIIKECYEKEKIPFLVIESAKRDYRQLLAEEIFKNNLNIFTVGDSTTSPIRINPFYIQPFTHPLVHIDYLKSIFNASFSLYGPMPHIVEKCLHNIYSKRGWNLTTGTHPHFLDKNGEFDLSHYQRPEHFYSFPTLTDLKIEIDNYINTELDYKGELRDNIRTAIITRIESLCVGAKGQMFNTYDFYSMEKLLTEPTIFEMENLADDDDKAFFVGLILVLVNEYRQVSNPAINPGTEKKGLQHLFVIEEAHRLLKNVNTEKSNEMLGNPKGKAVEFFCNAISEMRSLGQGVIVVEQIPSKISPDVIKNSNTKIVHRLVSKDDQSLLSGALSISEDDALYLNRLKTGYALVHKEGMERPIECQIYNKIKGFSYDNDKIIRIMKNKVLNSLHFYQSYELIENLGKKGTEQIIKFFNSICLIQEENYKELLNIFTKEFEKIIKLNNFYCDLNINIIADYLSLNILKLLSKGIYSSRAEFPKEFKNKLVSVLKSEIKLEDVITLLSLYWNKQTDLQITEIVKELTICHLDKCKLEKNETNLENTIKSFFYIIDNEKVNLIKQLILNKNG